MKVAFILYGFFRTFEYCNDTLAKYILEPTNCDVFINTPNIIDIKTQKKINDKEMISFFGNNLKEYKTREYNEQIFKDFTITNNIKDFIPETGGRAVPITSFFYSFTQSVKTFQEYVEKNNEKYDVVIITRPDVKYHTNIRPEIVKQNKLNCPSYFLVNPDHELLDKYGETAERYAINHRRRPDGAGIFWNKNPSHQKWFNDQVMATSQENIAKYTNFYDNVASYYHENIIYNQETYIAAHAIKNGIDLVSSDFVDYELWRISRKSWI